MNTQLLIVEDSTTQAMRLRHFLEGHGFDVSIVQNGRDALDLVKEGKFKVDLIVSDIIMPEMNGYEFCDALKSDDDLKDLPIILWTQLADAEDIEKGLQSGADGLIQKSRGDKALLTVIHKLLGGECAQQDGNFLRGYEVLVVEDSQTQARHLQHLLEDHGSRVMVANNGKNALALLQERIPSLVISDIKMPEMDGYELCRRIKADDKLADLPVIMLTSLAAPDDVVSALEAGADHFLPKPFDDRSLLNKVCDVLEEKPNTEMGAGTEPLSLTYKNKTYCISATRDHMLNLLISTYEVATQQNEHLMRTQLQLKNLNEMLVVSNDELEEQTQMLKESESELMRQQKELQVTNEEMARKTEHLENQRRELEQTNAELEKTRQEIGKKAEELALASKYKSEFLANMSHELRTPLNSMLILADYLAKNDEGNLTKEQVESAEVICHSGRDLQELITEILDLSKIEAGKLDVQIGKLEFATVLKTIRGQFNPLAKKQKLDFTAEVAADLPQIFDTDRQRLEQILKNLLSNAFKFTKAGSVSLRVEKPGRDVRFRRHGLTPDSAVALSVVDTGFGIPADKQEDIFEAFQQADGSTSRNYGGTGLGLTVSRELARLLGGEIHLFSEPGEGSTFTLYLPLAYKAEPDTTQKLEAGVKVNPDTEVVAETTERAASLVESFATAGGASEPSSLSDDRHDIVQSDKSLLIIEDDEAFAKTLMNLGRKRGYKCIVTGCAASGLQLAIEFLPAAVLLDIGLPYVDGLVVLDNLKANFETRAIPVYVISGLDAAATSLQKRALGFLSKPTSTAAIEDVFAKIESLVESSVKRLLVIEDDAEAQRAIHTLFKNEDLTITNADSGEEAEKLLKAKSFDCVVLDLSLGDMTGFELLRSLRSDDSIQLPPVIIYTGKEPTEEERTELSGHAQSIVVKDANSPERLLDEVSLLLHRVETELPPEQRRIIRMLYKSDKTLLDKKILVVDDDMRNSYALSKVFEQHGMRVTVADNGQLALEKLEADPDYDMVLMDIMMPVMDGYEAIRRIRSQERFQQLLIICLTAKAMLADRQKCLEVGANDYLSKPVDINRLLSMMRVWLYAIERRTVVST